MGHEVKLIAPQFVKPYVKSQKNDANDAEAICEAVGRPNMRFVTAKTVAQQDMLAVHRIRSELVRQRTAKANQIRGLLAEYGVIVPVGINALRRALPEIQEDVENGLSDLFRRLLIGLQSDLIELDQRVDQLDSEIQTAAKENEIARRLQSIPGIGPITAIALAASVGDGLRGRFSDQTPPRGCPSWPGGDILHKQVGYTRAVAPSRQRRDSLLLPRCCRFDPDSRCKNRWPDPPASRVQRVIHHRPPSRQRKWRAPGRAAVDNSAAHSDPAASNPAPPQPRPPNLHLLIGRSPYMPYAGCSLLGRQLSMTCRLNLLALGLM